MPSTNKIDRFSTIKPGDLVTFRILVVDFDADVVRTEQREGRALTKSSLTEVLVTAKGHSFTVFIHQYVNHKAASHG